jgi:hypothetical protein
MTDPQTIRQRAEQWYARFDITIDVLARGPWDLDQHARWAAPYDAMDPRVTRIHLRPSDQADMIQCEAFGQAARAEARIDRE